MHRSQRPGGLLLNVHPQPRPCPIEVQTGTGTSDIGQLVYTPAFTDTISKADEAFVSLDRDGIFRNERHEEFLLLHHFASLLEWQEYMAKEGHYYLPPAAAMSETINRRLAITGAELVLREWIQASRFRRLG